MSRQRKPSRHASVDEQIQVVLAVLKGELSLAEAARRHGVTSATVSNWRDWDAGTHLLAAARAQPLREAAEGPWPSPKVDQIEAVAAKYAAERPAWGHRKIAAMMRADGYQVSTSTVERALRRRGLLLPSGSARTGARGRGCGSGCSATHRESGTSSGRWTSPNSRPPAAGSGGSAQSSTTPPSTVSPPPSPPPAAARMHSPACVALSPRPNAS